MQTPDAFDVSVFINCPFDAEYQAILHPVLFTIIEFGLTPRIASESFDSGQARLAKIADLMGVCRFSIHDLSRSTSHAPKSTPRMNMPFELGMDFGLRLHANTHLAQKEFLILDDRPHQYQKGLSDLSGFDIKHHNNDGEQASRVVARWLTTRCKTDEIPPSKVWLRYQTYFLEWHYERQLSLGASEKDIQDYPTDLMLNAMHKWVKAGKPYSYD